LPAAFGGSAAVMRSAKLLKTQVKLKRAYEPVAGVTACASWSTTCGRGGLSRCGGQSLTEGDRAEN